MFRGFFKKHAQIIFVALIAAVNFSFASGQEKSVRVITFNIRYDEPRDGENTWGNRKTKVSDLIRFHRADLIGVQEALSGQLGDLKTLLPGFAQCGVGRTDGKSAGEFSTIIYRASRFKMLECQTFWLSQTPEIAGSKGWDADYPRIVTWAKFRDNETKKTFFQFNTHFDHIGKIARAESARLLLTRIEKIAGKPPFIVTGDFNAVEKDEPYQILTTGAGFRLKDSRYLSINAPYGSTSTFNAFGPLQPDRKIDYIFVGDGVKVVEHAVLSDQWDGKWASDHLPVLAEILLGIR